MLSESSEKSAGSHEGNSISNNYLIMWLGLQPDMTFVDQGPKLRCGCALLHNASDVRLIPVSVSGRFDRYARGLWAINV